MEKLTLEEIAALESILSIVRQGGDARLVARSKPAVAISQKLTAQRAQLSATNPQNPLNRN